MRRIQSPIVMLIILFMLPGLVWYQQTGDLSVYFSKTVPEGQFIFVLSKLMGMVALMCMIWQMIITLLSKLQFIPAHWLGARHRVFGGLILFLALTHSVLFMTAVSIRQGEMAWALFVPDFRDFYHTHLSFGLFGLIALFVVALAGLVRVARQYQWSIFVHRAYWFSIGFIYFHALAIGSEAQSKTGFVLYVSLGVIAAGLWCLYSIKQVRLKMVTSQ